MCEEQTLFTVALHQTSYIKTHTKNTIHSLCLICLYFSFPSLDSSFWLYLSFLFGVFPLDHLLESHYYSSDPLTFFHTFHPPLPGLDCHPSSLDFSCSPHFLFLTPLSPSTVFSPCLLPTFLFPFPISTPNFSLPIPQLTPLPSASSTSLTIRDG